MKKTVLISLAALMVAVSASAQKQGDKWIFGQEAGVDFSTGVPVAITGVTGTDTPTTLMQEGTASIADSAGNLLFYSSGQTAWNRYNKVMPHGHGLMGGISSTQAAIIVPLPGSSRYFYLFTTDQFQSYFMPSAVAGCRYSIIDICADSGRGDVDTLHKNILLVDTATEQLAAVADSAGTGYWIMTHKMFSNAFYAFHLGASGITATAISHIGSIHGLADTVSYSGIPTAQGQMKFSPQGNRVAVVTGNTHPNVIEVFTFNNATGAVSDSMNLSPAALATGAGYGVEFSADGTKLFATNSGGYDPDAGIYEFDLGAGAGNVDSISSSASQLNNSTLNFGLQMGPDNKIYVVVHDYTTIGVINYPNLMGTAAGFNESALTLDGVNDYTFPAFIAGYQYHNTVSECSDITTMVATPGVSLLAMVYPNPVSNDFTVQCDGQWQATLTDLSGRSIMVLSGTGTATFSKGATTPGMYMLCIKTKDGVCNRKVVVE